MEPSAPAEDAPASADGRAAPPFLVCGIPKSGTTFLQRTLDLHPAVSCPSEQSFPALRDILAQALRHYAGVLETFDRRTGGQGASRYGATVEDDLFAAAIATLSKSFARGRPIHGLNDNTVFDNVARYDALLGRPKIVAIVRNPVDIGLSAWRNNRRLAREEPERASVHLGLNDNRKGSVEGYIEKLLPVYRTQMDRFLGYAEGRDNVLVVRYEALTADKAAELTRVLAFLGADRGADIVAHLTAGSSREAMAATSRNPAFFGLDPNDPDRASVSPDFRRKVLEAAITPRLRALGYDVSALMAGY